MPQLEKKGGWRKWWARRLHCNLSYLCSSPGFVLAISSFKFIPEMSHHATGIFAGTLKKITYDKSYLVIG